MLIMLEGPDGAGKSTLSEQLKEHFPAAATVHHGPAKGIGSRELAATYASSLKLALEGQTLIMDRGWPSEPIYSAVYRKVPSRITPVYRRMLERMALRDGAVTVLCLPSLYLCAEAFNSGREEMLESTDQLREVYEHYGLLESVTGTQIPVISYNRELTSLSALVATIRRALVVQSLTPKALLVCEKPGSASEEHGRVQVPFATFTGGGCSEALAAEFELFGIDEAKLAWANAYWVDGGENAIPLENRTRIFALGNVAAGYLRAKGVEFTQVPPPQHHYKYFPENVYKLVKELRA
jgi:thymidylate kinase